MLQQILSRSNTERAYKRVTSNKGAAGVDGVETTQLRSVLSEQWPRIKTEILEGKYKPQPVRRVQIDKPGGGIRPLGIPTTTDRLIQQAIQQVLGPAYEPEFSPHSYGFRPGKSAHDGVRQALSYINEGYTWVVDMDLKSFSGKVNHDYLMHLVSQRVHDKPLLKLIRRYLQAGVMCGGVVSPSRQGTPQGGPLSPLLPDILLDVLDAELERRGHRFVRYADDFSIYVASLTRFIEDELKLEVNQRKSGVRKARDMELLGYSFYPAPGGYRLRIPPKSLQRLKGTLREITRKTWPVSMSQRLKRLTQVCRGWVAYFKLADACKHLKRIDQWVRSRLRYCTRPNGNGCEPDTKPSGNWEPATGTPTSGPTPGKADGTRLIAMC